MALAAAWGRFTSGVAGIFCIEEYITAILTVLITALLNEFL